MKRILAFLLALSLVIAPLGHSFSAKAESYTDVTLTSTSGNDTSIDKANGCWVLYLNTSGYTCTDWNWKYDGFTIECNGITGTSGMVSSAGYNNLYCTIPTSLVPEENGTVFTIKAGNYNSLSNVDGIHITEDFTVVAVDGHLVHTTIHEVESAEPFNQTANIFYFNLRDAQGQPISTDYAGWDHFLAPAGYDGVSRISKENHGDVYSGVFVDGQPIDYDTHRFGFANTGNGTYFLDISGFSVTVGTKVTIKGFLATSVKAGTKEVVSNDFFKEFCFTYDGSVWTFSKPKNMEENRSLSLHYASDDAKYGNAVGIYLRGDDTIQADPSWGTYISFDEGENNGVFLNGTKTAVQMKKTSDQDWYVCLGDGSATASANDVVTIKGAITHKGKTAVFNEVSFVFDGTTWGPYIAVENCTFEQWYANDDNQYGNNSGIYLIGNDSLEHDATWGTALSFDEGEENGVFFNGTKQNASMKKITPNGWFVDLSAAGCTAETGDVVTIKGSITYKGKRAAFEAISLVFDGTTWSLAEDPNLEKGRSLSLDETATSSQSGIYLIGDDSLVAPGWNYAVNAQIGIGNGVFLNGTKTNVFMKKYDGNKWFVCLDDGGVDAQAGDVVSIKGVFTYGTSKIAFNEVEFTFDGTTWSQKEEGETISLDFVDLLSISKYNSSTGKWEIFLSTTKALPGADEATTFDVVMNFAGQDQVITCKKSSSQQAFAFEIDGSAIPENPAEEVTLVVKKGLYDVTGTDVKIKIESNTELYFANGLVSLISSNIQIDEKDIAFVLDRSTAGGGNQSGIYLIAEDNVPYDTTWSTQTVAYEGKPNGVFLNGVKTDAFLKKYDTNKYFVVLGDVNVTPEEGDVVVIKGVFKTNNYISSYLEYKMMFKKGSWVDGTEVETNYTTITIDEYDNKVSTYNKTLDRWELYFSTKEKMPGEVDQSFNSVKVDVNGTEYMMPCFHAGYRDAFFLIIEGDKVQKGDVVTLTIGGKAKSEDQTIGVDVQEFKLYMNPYGQSLEGYLEPADVKEENVKLTLDTKTLGWMAGTESGFYLLTPDNFSVDETWATPIRAVTYDENSGIFYNDTKIDAPLKKYADGKIYADIAGAGIFAKDKDKITIKGIFVLDDYAVSYTEQSYYFNGQSWGTTYTKPIEKTTTNLIPIGIKSMSSYNPERKAWDIYVQVEGTIPGGHDYEYKSLSYEVDGKTYEANVYRVDDSLVFFVPDTILPADAKDGSAVTLKAGMASDNYNIYDIKLTKDYTAYIYRKMVSDVKPTEDTKFLDVTIPGLITTRRFNEDVKEWQLLFKVEEEFDVEDGTRYFDLPIKLNGKTYEEINVFRSGECLYVSIPESILPANAKSATVSIDKGATAVANFGWNGIRLKNDVTVYLFDGVWNNVKFTEVQQTEVKVEHINFSNYNSEVSRWDIYLNMNTELPGTGWFEYYEGVTAYLNGKEYTTYANKADYPTDKLLYIALDEKTFGKFKDGDVVYFPGDVVYDCGGYKMKNMRDFYLLYENGTWFEYYESDVEVPEVEDSIWENGRIEGYIPVQEEQGIMFTNVAPTNIIKSVEDMKDVTFTFDTTKMLSFNEDLPTNSMVLRGQPLAEGMDVSETALYGYNISFSYIEITEDNLPDNPELWGTHSQEVAVWKNGINYQLLDQYRMLYNWQKTEHPFFEYNEKYEYTVSIYNVEEDICMISVYCNQELIMQVVDHGTEDPRDPVYNAGEFQIYASCPQYLYAPEVELDTLEASATECYIGDQVRVSATYPAVLEGAEYTVDGEGATIKDGVFKATKPGTYTVSGTFNGEDKGTVQIKVTEKPQKVNVAEETGTFPIIPVAIGGGAALILAATLVIVFLKKKKNTLAE